AYFDEALTGLEKGSSVKFRGVTVGVVERIRFASDKKHLEVQAVLFDDTLNDLGLSAENLESENGLLQRLRAQVVMSWVTSTAFIQVDYFPDPPRGSQQLPFAVPGDGPTLRTVPSTAKSLESSVRDLLRELPAVASAAREVVDLVRTELAAARLPEVSRRAQTLLAKVERQFDMLEQQGTIAAATAAVKSVGATAAALGSEQPGLHELLAQWRDLARDARAAIDSVDAAGLGAQVRGSAGAVATSMQGIERDLRQELLQLHRTLQSVERLANLLERDPAALLRGRSGGATDSPLRRSGR
ncbi:MAG: MlaD family protein, partial [Planctomycetota bacterium]